MKVIGPYTVLDEKPLGQGGNGTVWRCKSAAEEVLAVKVLKRVKPTSEPFRRFQAEIAVLQRLGDDPGILPIRDCHLAEDGSASWLAMPVAVPIAYALGAAPSPESVVAAMAAIAKTLARLDSQGIRHRDIKPGNLYRFEDRWVLGDFGLVDYPEKEDLTAPGTKLGPMYFMAPEMLLSPGTADAAKADVFSLAKTLWVLLTGNLYPTPGPHDPTEKLCSLLTYVVASRLGSLDSLLQAMTRMSPEARISAADAALQLEAWLSPPTITEPIEIDSVMGRVRDALNRPRSAQAREALMADQAKAAFGQLVSQTSRLVDRIQNDLQMPFRRGFDVPPVCRRRVGFGRGATVWKDSRVWDAKVGGRNGAVFSVICVAELVDPDLLFISTSLRAFAVTGGHDVKTSDTFFLQGANDEARLGMPELENKIVEILKSINELLPKALEHFAKLLGTYAR